MSQTTGSYSSRVRAWLRDLRKKRPVRMRNLMMFHGSCGHTTVEEISDEVFERYATQPGYGSVGRVELNRSRVGIRTRMVYVWPARYCTCYPCVKTLIMEDLRGR